jgi:hypothetical protein
MSTTTNKQTLSLRKKRKTLKLKCNKQTNKEQWKKIVKQLLHLHTGSSNCIFRFIRRWGEVMRRVIQARALLLLCWRRAAAMDNRSRLCLSSEEEARKGFLWESLLGFLRSRV